MAEQGEDGLGLLCVHAHPDDEASSTGGILARYAAEGIRTAVVTCTGGERGEIHNMDAVAVAPRLAEVRLGELSAALRLLGAGEPRMLGYVDSGMMGTDGNDDPKSFWRADTHEAVGRLVAQIRAFRPDVVTAYDAYGGYGHPDHLQTHRIGVLAAEAAGIAPLYPEAGPPWRVRKVYLSTFASSMFTEMFAELAARGLFPPGDDAGEGAPEELPGDEGEMPPGTPDELIGAVVDIGPQLATKWAALQAHSSQMDPESFFLKMPEDLRVRMFGQERFLRLRSDVEVRHVEDDLFTGLR